MLNRIKILEENLRFKLTVRFYLILFFSHEMFFLKHKMSLNSDKMFLFFKTQNEAELWLKQKRKCVGCKYW